MAKAHDWRTIILLIIVFIWFIIYLQKWKYFVYTMTEERFVGLKFNKAFKTHITLHEAQGYFVNTVTVERLVGLKFVRHFKHKLLYILKSIKKKKIKVKKYIGLVFY